jgi:guanylate kinase
VRHLGFSALAAKRVIVVTGTSGAGKGTLEKPLLERKPQLELAVSATTRERRAGEAEGREYYFVSDQQFQQLVDKGAFLEHMAHPWGQRVGTLRSEIERIQKAGRVPLLDLETQGALAVRDEVPGALTIFVRAPTFAELERRLRDRATESSGEIDERLAIAHEQLAQEDEFDYVIVNDDLERAVNELEAIVDRELGIAGTLSGRDPSTHRQPARPR